MPASIISAGISGVSQVAGASASGKGAKAAAQIQQQTAQQQIAAAQQFEAQAAARYQPDIDQANRASGVYAGLLGDGGDPAASQAAYDTWKNSAGYQNNYNEALRATNANAYAGGMGRSGAAMKALETQGANVANNYMQTYLGNLNTQVQTGAQAKAALTGAGQTQLSASNSALQSSADAQSNASLISGNAWANAIKNIGNSAADAYKSSYGGK